MKTIHEFINFTNLKGNRIKLTLMLIIPSLLYSLALSFFNTIVYISAFSNYYYFALYVFVLGTSFIYLILLFQFIHKKRDIEIPHSMKPYVLPYFFLQSVFFLIMIGSAWGSMALLQYASSLTSVMSVVCTLLAIFYIPVQTFSFFYLFDGEKNPFVILWKATKKVLKHYQFCFYALLTLALVAMLYNLIMDVFFGIGSNFVPMLLVHDIMISSNPFAFAGTYVAFAFENVNMWGPVLVSVIYGVLMCSVLVYYYMGMLCAYDEDIKI
ncbi:hypothetical protein ACWG0P_06410 [Amedibacillus sp. YH-ame6]